MGTIMPEYETLKGTPLGIVVILDQWKRGGGVSKQVQVGNA